jgi:glycosyltransferase involved in cell wall biosynthesis
MIKMRSYVRNLLNSFVGCTVVSKQEADLIHQVAPGYDSLEIVPNFVDLSEYGITNGSVKPGRMVFAGALTYFANHDGITWFLREVFPVVRRELSDAELIVTGRANGNSIPTRPGVTLTGFVDDVRPIVSSACASVVPIRLGGGTRLKVLEAMALRTPVVATSKGVEGLDVVHGEHVLIADEPHEFAEAIIQVFRDPQLREMLSENAYALVQSKYDYSAVMPRFLEVVELASQS